MSKVTFILLVGFVIFGSYHYWPDATKHVGHKFIDTAGAALKAGYNEAQASKR